MPLLKNYEGNEIALTGMCSGPWLTSNSELAFSEAMMSSGRPVSSL